MPPGRPPAGPHVGWSGLRPCCCCLVAQLCPTFWEPIDCSWPGASVHGISQARIREWVAISFSGGSSWPRDRTCLSFIGRRILYSWATREALDGICCYLFLLIISLVIYISQEEYTLNIHLKLCLLDCRLPEGRIMSYSFLCLPLPHEWMNEQRKVPGGLPT